MQPLFQTAGYVGKTHVHRTLAPCAWWGSEWIKNQFAFDLELIQNTFTADSTPIDLLCNPFRNSDRTLAQTFHNTFRHKSELGEIPTITQVDLWQNSIRTHSEPMQDTFRTQSQLIQNSFRAHSDAIQNPWDSILFIWDSGECMQWNPFCISMGF